MVIKKARNVRRVSTARENVLNSKRSTARHQAADGSQARQGSGRPVQSGPRRGAYGIYESEINIEIGWTWDGGITSGIGSWRRPGNNGGFVASKPLDA